MTCSHTYHIFPVRIEEGDGCDVFFRLLDIHDLRSPLHIRAELVEDRVLMTLCHLPRLQIHGFKASTCITARTWLSIRIKHKIPA